MTLSQAGVLVSRAIGLVFLVEALLGLLGMLYIFSYLGTGGAGGSGFRSPYGPPFTMQSLMMLLFTLLPHVAKLVLGFLMIYFSRVASRWLTKGLAENDCE